MSCDEEDIWEFYSDDEKDFQDPMANTVVEYDDFLESLLNRSAADSADDDGQCNPGVLDLGDILDESSEPLLCTEDLNDYENQHEYDLGNELPDLEPSSSELLICGEDYGTLDLNDLEEDEEYLLLKDYEGYAESDEVQDPCHLNGSDEYLLCYDGGATEESVEYEYWYPAQDVPFASEDSPFFNELREITNYEDATVGLFEEFLCQQFMEKLNVVSASPKKSAASKDFSTPECRRLAGNDGVNATQSSSAGSRKSSSSLNVEAAEFVPSVTIAAACEELKENGIENSTPSVKPRLSMIRALRRGRSTR